MGRNINGEFEFDVIRHKDTAAAWSQELKVIFVLRGNGWLHTEEGDRTYAISREDIFVINSFQMHSVVLEENGLAISLSLSPSFLAAASPETEDRNVNCKSFLHEEEKQQLFDIIRKDLALAFRAWYKKESELSIHLRSRVMALADDLYRYFSENVENTGRESGRERLRAAVEYIHRNYREGITLADLASQTYLSTSYISRSFQKYMGVSFTGYLTQVRLFHAALLLQGEGTVTEIAYESGFSSASALIDAFKQYRGITPGQYRRNLGKRPVTDNAEEMKTAEGFSMAFVSLMKYADKAEEAAEPVVTGVCEISVNTGIVKRQLRHTWKTMINAGYARDLLNASMQNQILDIQKSVGFRYIRCKGVVDDDMMLYSRDVNGYSSFNYVYLDQVLDFILSAGAKPMLELGHMPSAMAQKKVQFFKRPSFISPPAELEQWRLLIESLMEHLIGRYGMEELKKWLFVPWISMDMHLFGLFVKEDFGEIYSVTYQEIKKACREFVICGPGTTLLSLEAAKWFCDLCRERDCIPDIFTVRSYAAIDPEEEKSGLKLVENNESFYMAVDGDEDCLMHLRRKVKDFLEAGGEGFCGLPVLMDEWSNNIWQRDLCNDTCYKSAYLFKSIMENHDSYYGLGYFSISDQLDEIAPAAEAFHGGFGLFTQNGIAKSAYRAMQLLSRAGDKLIAKGSGYFITASEDEIQIFLHNYCHYDMLYRYRNTTNLTKTRRYKVFQERAPRSFHIQLEGVRPGRHEVRRYGIGRKGGSAYDAWIDMGAPEPMTKEEEKTLMRLSGPVYRREEAEAEGLLKIKASLMPHEVCLITISI